MNVMFISQCSKNALVETRRILDQFAERRGDRTWQTPITQQGLDTLYKMLRKTARKNTAVACHWIRSKDHSELLWIVGDIRRFNVQGATPTNTTVRDILRTRDENDWRTAEEIRLLTVLAALFHDFGKANQTFQKKLNSRKPVADAYRHEWIALRMFESFIGHDNDQAWLTRLTTLSEKTDRMWIKNLLRDGLDQRLQSPFKYLPPLARVIGWMIVSHHRLPVQEKKTPLHSAALIRLPENIEEQWCGCRVDIKAKDIENCWLFQKGLPFDSLSWRREVGKIAKAILSRHGMLTTDWFNNPYILYLSRMALMLADHYYSSEPSYLRYGDVKYPLYANTDRATGLLKQRLDEHLIGVSVNASRIVRTLPRLVLKLPRIARHKGFRQRSRDTRFRWQDRAFDLAESLQMHTEQRGFFGVNMASTGYGKTLANGRILYALASPQHGARFSIALGLRTLTLQTGEVYREQMGLGAEDLAILVGGGAIRALHEYQLERDTQMASNSESTADLLPEQHYVHFEGSLEDGPLNRWIGKNPDVQKLINAPVLVCTIDHLMPATESTRGGHQIAPMLRLLSADLVLDEPDDFGIDDLPALTRLVHWAGLLGSRVLLSSATLPPALVQGLFQAYLEGRKIYQYNRGIPGQPLNVCCAWFDEFSAKASEHAVADSFQIAHQHFVDKRLGNLAQTEVRRRAEIIHLSIACGQTRETICAKLAKILHQQVHDLHNLHHSDDPVTMKRISFGLIRMANIGPLVETAHGLCTLGASENYRVHFCVYHSQHPLLVRSGIEQRLDRFLNRKNPEAVFQEPDIRQQLDTTSEQDHIFVVLATPVAEVGRDHDYDWGIVEPSSMRSIIQLAGRIRRHRSGLCTTPNLYLLDTNVRYLEHGAGHPAFCRPGFESEQFPLDQHYLSELLTPEQVAVIDASNRISERAEPCSRQNLVDLEHARLRALMIGTDKVERLKTIPVHWWWTTHAGLSGELQRKQPFRDDPLGRQRYGLFPDGDGVPQFMRFEDDGVLTPVNNLLHPVSLEPGPRVSFWGVTDYFEALEALADALQMETDACAHRFCIFDLPRINAEQGWNYHPAFGFSRYR